MSLSRRELFRYGAAATLAASAVPAGTASAVEVSTPAEGTAAHIVAAYRELQIGRGRHSTHRDQALAALDQVAESYDAAMTVTGDQLWPDLPTGPGSDYFPTMYYRLRTIAVDWATPGSALSARTGQADRIRAALDILYRTEYNENTAELGNWYSYEIGVPYWLLQTVVAMGDQLSTADIQRYLRPVLRFVADPNQRTATKGLVETGANRADKSLITVVSGALVGDADRIAAGIAAVTDTVGNGAANLVARVTSGDGYHTDGSFIQHSVVPYPGHYGLVLLSAAAGLAYLTAGTANQLNPDVCQRFCDAVTDVYAPFVFAGSMMEPVRGRMLSRQGETGHDAGHQLIAATVLLARCAPNSATGANLASLAANWIDQGSYAPYLDVSNVGRFSGGLQPVGVPEVEYAEELLATRPSRPAVTAVHRTFPQSDRMVHVTRDWSASLGLGSTRICRYESINGQNLHGWYVGDGVLYTFLPGQQGHYSDAYWPTVDATALPGTTEQVGTPPALQATPLTGNAWVGGARWDAQYGAHGLDFTSQDGKLTGKKSWFFTPDAVLCLGAGITGSSGQPVRTTIENRNLGEHGTAGLVADWQPRPADLGHATVLPHTRWLHLAGVAGYVLLTDTAVTVLRADRTGTWYGVDTGANTHGTTVPYTRRYQQILLDHGTDPAAAHYAYAVLPGATEWQTWSASARWQVLANTATVQAVRLSRTLTAASFFTAGTVDGLTVSGPASALWGRTDRGWTLALSDPSQLQDTVRVTAPGAGRRVVAADPSVTVLATRPNLVVDIKVAGSLGGTHTLTVR